MADVDTSMGMDGGNGAETPPAADAMPDKGDGKNTVVLSADHFPQGMALKKGDKVTLSVTSDPDSEGNVTGYFEPMAGMAKEDAGKDWADGFRKSMSPMASQEEAA